MTANSISPVIKLRRAEGSGAIIGYLPVGFPDLSTSIDAAVVLLECGFDAVELGVPYSDPVMDGPVIQRAADAALEAGFRIPDLFEAVAGIRERCPAPVLAMTYWNPVVQYGVDRFASDLAEVGGAGLITPDITPEVASDWIAASEATGLDRVFLAAPSSSQERLRLIAEASRGFTYAVSTMGVTGIRAELDTAAKTLVARMRSAGVENACVGVGISEPAHVKDVLEYADGAIIGSALVRALADNGLRGLRSLATELVAARLTS